MRHASNVTFLRPAPRPQPAELRLVGRAPDAMPLLPRRAFATRYVSIPRDVLLWALAVAFGGGVLLGLLLGAPL